MEENQTQVETQNTGNETAAAPQPELTVTDLNNLRSIIDVAVRRGVFAANEISAVGATYDRLNKFLGSITPPATDAQNQ